MTINKRIEPFKYIGGRDFTSKVVKVMIPELYNHSVINFMSIEQEGSTFIVEKEVHQAVNGTYLVDIDGLFSRNNIQRLPGKKLAIRLIGSTLTVENMK